VAERHPFTQAGLSKLVGRQGARLVIHDPRIKGLRAELRAGGAIAFYVLRRLPGGKPLRVRIGPFPEVTVDDARTQAMDLLAKIVKGHNPVVERRIRRQEATLKELFVHWLQGAKQRKKSWPEDERMFNKYLLNLHNRKLSSITRPDVRAWHNKVGEVHGPYQANRALALLRAVYNAGEDLGYEGMNPAARVKPFHEEERDRFLLPEELPRFFQAVMNEPSEVVRDFVFLKLFTGERRSQVCAMRWADISLERAEWRLPEPKQGKPHYVHLSTPALAILRRRKEASDGEYVLPGRRTGQHLKDPTKNWRRILKAAGIEGVRIHDLRRTLGSYMAIQGSSLNIIGAALGHSRPETTKIYARLTSNAVANQVDKAVEVIEATAKPLTKEPTARGA